MADRITKLDAAKVRRIHHLHGGTHSPSIFDVKEVLGKKAVSDFCFLSNPYFPPRQLVEELKKDFLATMQAYPSQNYYTSKLVSGITGIPLHNIAVGNGASEIIDWALTTYANKIVIPLPTFSEYYDVMNVEGKQVVYLEREECEGFELDDGEFVKKVKESGADAALIINPDNPTGAYIPLERIEAIVKKLRGKALLIVDESFIHYANRDEVPSASGLVDKYENLLVIKSMSKDYGVAGLRLGYAVANRTMIEKLRSELPVWNTSSFAERFLKLLPKYRGHYERARKKAIGTVQRLCSRLATVPYLKTYPTRANFVLAKITREGLHSTDLRDLLLLKYGYYVRDCCNKLGLRGEYLRIASKTDEENRKLVKALKEIA